MGGNITMETSSNGKNDQREDLTLNRQYGANTQGVFFLTATPLKS